MYLNDQSTDKSFIQRLLSDTLHMENNFERQIKKMKSISTIAIWGTGAAGRITGKYFIDHGIPFHCFVQSDPTGETTFMGLPLYSKKEFYKKFPDAMVMLACNYDYRIHEELELMHYRDYLYADPGYLLLRPDNIRAVLLKFQDEINEAYSLLADEKSKIVFENVLKHQLIYDIDLMRSVYDKNQYFNNDLISHVDGTFVDCGAFNGDTLQNFVCFTEDTQFEYYALEPSGNEYLKLKKRVEENDWSNVKPIRLGAWSKKGKLKFADEAPGETKIDEDGALEIDVDSIDHILNGQPAGFIKMDIEGAEMEALNGAVMTIRNFTPTLAISAYHKLQDLWEIPLWIHRIKKDYQIYYRHHMWNLADTVCYGIPLEKREVKNEL